MGTVDVTGGSHSVEVDEHRLATLATAFGHAGRDTLSASFHLHRYLADPDLATGALFDPAGYAAYELALESALDGALGLTWAGGRCELTDAELRGAALLYRGADRLNGLHDAALGVFELPGAAGEFGVGLLTGDGVSRSAQRALTDSPELADTLMTVTQSGVPSPALSGLHALGLPTGLQAAANAMPDGHGVAVRTGVWGVDAAGAAARPPRRLSDVIAALAQLNDDPHHGAIDVRILQRADGSRTVIVDITGTKSWTPGRTSDITSLVTNGRSLYGERTSYEQGVLQAMHDAGVTSTDDVMLVGHSEGGMVAVTTARDAVRSRQFHVTHVVTAGSPVGISARSLPGGVTLLALENSHDLVPHLDGVANPDRRNVVTASDAHGNGTIGDDHSLEDGYEPLARDVQTSTDPALRDYLHGCTRYFDAQTVTTRTYQVVRHY